MELCEKYNEMFKPKEKEVFTLEQEMITFISIIAESHQSEKTVCVETIELEYKRLQEASVKDEYDKFVRGTIINYDTEYKSYWNIPYRVTYEGGD